MITRCSPIITDVLVHLDGIDPQRGVHRCGLVALHLYLPLIARITVDRDGSGRLVILFCLGSLSDTRTRLRSSPSQSCSLPCHAASLISTSLKCTAEHKKDIADGMELNECPLFTLDADQQDINLFCATDFCISLNNFKFGSPKAIEGFVQALVENIWLVQGKEIATDPKGWLVCSPAYSFVPVLVVLL